MGYTRNPGSIRFRNLARSLLLEGQLQVHNEQRHGDCEDAIDERNESPEFYQVRVRKRLCAHRFPSKLIGKELQDSVVDHLRSSVFRIVIGIRDDLCFQTSHLAGGAPEDFLRFVNHFMVADE
jgi:hypothetical protein